MNTMIKNKGMTGFHLKMLGVLTMTFDHIHQMFPYIFTNSLLSMIGRLALPIFLFIGAEGFHYTRNKKSHILKFLLFSWAMSILNMMIGRNFHFSNDIILTNNIFSTLLSMGIVCYSIDLFRTKNLKNIIIGICLVLMPVFSMFIPAIIPSLQNETLINYISLAPFFLPSYFFVEGGMIAVLLGASFYLFRDKKIISYSMLIIVSLISTGFNFNNLFTENIQWMMLFAIIPIILYNGQKGKDAKHFFYLYYPSHIYVLYFISYFLINSFK